MSDNSPRTLHDALAAELRAAQGVANINVRTWANRTSITHDTIYRILNGRRAVTVVELVELCHALPDDPLELIERAAQRAGLAVGDDGANELVRSDRAQLALEAADLYSDLETAYRQARQSLSKTGQLLPLREWRAFLDGAGSDQLVTSLASFLDVPAEYLLGQMPDEHEETKRLEARLRLTRSMRSLGVTKMAARTLDELGPEELETVEATIRALVEREEGLS